VDTVKNWNEIFNCDSKTGSLRWKARAGNRVRCGDIVGCPDAHGYLQVQHEGKKHKVHRVIYEMNHGNIPQGQHMHHINGLKSDNRLTNLRLVTSSEKPEDVSGG